MYKGEEPLSAKQVVEVIITLMYRASHIYRLSPSFNAKINLKYPKTLAFSARRFLLALKSIFQNYDSFFLNFLISPENRNLDYRSQCKD